MTATPETTPGAAPDLDALGSEMIDAARAAIREHGAALRDVAEMELRALAAALAGIASQFASGQIDRGKAQRYLNIHRNSVRSVLTGVEGLSVLASEHVLDAATRVAVAVVNRFVGTKLL